MVTFTFAAGAVPALNSWGQGTTKQQAQQRVQQRHLDRVQQHQQREQQRELAGLGVDVQEGRGARAKRPPKRDEPDSPEEEAQKSFLPAHMWTPEEDKRMIGGVHRFGLNWEKVAEQLPGRSAGAVRKRYVGDLLPQVGSSQKMPEPKPNATVGAGGENSVLSW